MNRLTLIILTILSTVLSMGAQAVRINVDYETVAAMSAAYGVEVISEKYYNDQLGEILDRYSAAEVAAAAIFATKYLDRKAMTNIGIWGDGTENYYYRRIYNLVASKIMPKILVVARQMLNSPQTALYWGSYLMKVCDETKNLCYQFESVVTNSTLTFQDIAFLSINPEVARLLDVTKLGNIDWERMLDDIASVSADFTKENLVADLDHLYSMAADLVASLGGSAASMVYDESEFNAAIDGNVYAIIELLTRYEAIYDSLSQSVGGTLMSMIGGPENIHNLFCISDYRLTAWLSDYLTNSPNTYYTQRYYIYRDVVSDEQELVMDYQPTHGQYLRLSHPGSPTGADLDNIKRNSETYAGWNQNRINALNSSNAAKHYIDYYRLLNYMYTGSASGSLYAFAYCIKVTKDKTVREVVYEDVFDSYSMDRQSFVTKMNLKLAAYNENEEDVKYYLGIDDKQYYTATDEARMRGCETAIISATCHDTAELGSGTTQFKCRDCKGILNTHSRQCAMMTTVAESAPDTSELDTYEQSATDKINELESRISALEQENSDLIKQISKADVETAAELRQRFNANKDEITSLRQELTEWKKNLKDIQKAKEDMVKGEEVATDDHYRIPAIMAECQDNYGLRWTDNGSWSGFTYTRHATALNLKGTITFTATLSIARKPKKVLGILIHRCITQISWTLNGSYSDSQVVDIIELDPAAKDSDKANLVNQHISQAAQDYPSCDITTEYIQSEPIETSTNGDTYHLLWASDRLDIARQVETRLTHIYSNLVSLEKMMNYKMSILDVMKRVAPYINDNYGRRQGIIQESYEQWRTNARDIHHNEIFPDE